MNWITRRRGAAEAVGLRPEAEGRMVNSEVRIQESRAGVEPLIARMNADKGRNPGVFDRITG
jgi:hypothetical protein